jgi:glutamate/tyrosine decarboxylase-like PLP-dependent enzyme
MSIKKSYQEALTDAAARGQRYLESIHERHVGVLPDALDDLPKLGGPLSAEGQDPTSVLKLLDEIGSPATIANTGGRFFGGVIGGALPASVAAHWLADAWDQNACLFDFSPVSAYLEDVVLGWLVDLFGLPSTSGGAFVTGTQMADVTALAAARGALLRQAGWDVESEGLFAAPPVTVIVGEEVHATMLKALALLGFGRSRVHVVPADSQGRMKASEIPRLQGPVIVIAQVGNVNTGACDPVGEICDVARNMNAWVHVDGAFGLWAATAPTRKYLVNGIADADSWATDGHKWLNVPHDSGIAIVRDADALRRAMSITAAYYPEPGAKRDPMKWGPESSRRARAIEIWAALRSLGTDGVADLIERTCKHAATGCGRSRTRDVRRLRTDRSSRLSTTRCASSPVTSNNSRYGVASEANLVMSRQRESTPNPRKAAPRTFSEVRFVETSAALGGISASSGRFDGENQIP